MHLMTFQSGNVTKTIVLELVHSVHLYNIGDHNICVDVHMMMGDAVRVYTNIGGGEPAKLRADGIRNDILAALAELEPNWIVKESV
jgi:hypothetical protein